MAEPKPVFARIETIKEAEDAEEKTQKKVKNNINGPKLNCCRSLTIA